LSDEGRVEELRWGEGGGGSGWLGEEGSKMNDSLCGKNEEENIKRVSLCWVLLLTND
jgi:hypothetical protein